MLHIRQADEYIRKKLIEAGMGNKGKCHPERSEGSSWGSKSSPKISALALTSRLAEKILRCTQDRMTPYFLYVYCFYELLSYMFVSLKLGGIGQTANANSGSYRIGFDFEIAPGGERRGA
jgi:hypothetical protein